MSLNIAKTVADDSLITLTGRLDTTTAPQLDEALVDVLPVAQKLTIDMTDLQYISSAGLRIILKAHKAMKGNLKLTHVCDAVKEVFEITGFTDFLDFE